MSKRNSCETLGVCQARTPDCTGCHHQSLQPMSAAPAKTHLSIRPPFTQDEAHGHLVHLTEREAFSWAQVRDWAACLLVAAVALFCCAMVAGYLSVKLFGCSA